MTFNELYSANMAWDSRTSISIVAEADSGGQLGPVRGTAGDLVEIWGSVRVVSFGLYKVVISYDDFKERL